MFNFTLTASFSSHTRPAYRQRTMSLLLHSTLLEMKQTGGDWALGNVSRTILIPFCIAISLSSQSYFLSTYHPLPIVLYTLYRLYVGLEACSIGLSGFFSLEMELLPRPSMERKMFACHCCSPHYHCHDNCNGFCCFLLLSPIRGSRVPKGQSSA
jgi:hypothetical protein